MNGPASLDQLVSDAEKQLWINDGYAAFYPAMLASTRCIIDGEMRNPLTAVAHLAYGWMPTILKNFTMGHAAQRKLISHVDKAGSAKNALGLIAKLGDIAPINNSWVGTSKVFHFINPKAFPIWDSKVAKHFGKTYAGAVNRKSAYEDYLAYAIKHGDDPAVKRFAATHKDKWKHNISPMRSMELILFLSQQYRDDLARKTKNDVKKEAK